MGRKKDDIFGSMPQDPHARLQGNKIIRAGIAQGVSPTDVLGHRATRIPGTANLKNKG